MRRFLLFLLISSLFLATCFDGNNGVQAQSQDTYSLALQGFVWNHTTLNALVVAAYNESWWNPAYLNISLRAIGQWNDAIATFAANYSDYSYLSDLTIQPTISNETQPGFDIYINWTESPFSNTDEVGLTQLFPNYEKIITNCSVNLATHSHHGDSLMEGDMQNIALHELGHSLGLAHGNYTADLMYAYYTIGGPAKTVSSLDVYGVATLFAWEKNSSSLYPVSRWLKEDSVILPSNIPYQMLPVSAANASPQTLADNPVIQTLVLMFGILIHPDVFALAVLFVSVLVIIAIIPRRKKRAKAG